MAVSTSPEARRDIDQITLRIAQDYLIFFRKTRRGIQIVRIIHGAQRWERILKGKK